MVVAKSSNLSGNICKTIFCNRIRQSIFQTINQHQCSQKTGMLKTCMFICILNVWCAWSSDWLDNGLWMMRKRWRERRGGRQGSLQQTWMKVPLKRPNHKPVGAKTKKRQNYRENPTSDNDNGVFLFPLPSSNCLRAVIVFRTQRYISNSMQILC